MKGRMTPEELKQLKRDVSLLKVVQSQGRKLTKQGRDFVTLCPFHREKSFPALSRLPKTCITALAVARAARCRTGCNTQNG